MCPTYPDHENDHQVCPPWFTLCPPGVSTSPWWPPSVSPPSSTPCTWWHSTILYFSVIWSFWCMYYLVASAKISLSSSAWSHNHHWYVYNQVAFDTINDVPDATIIKCLKISSTGLGFSFVCLQIIYRVKPQFFLLQSTIILKNFFLSKLYVQCVNGDDLLGKMNMLLYLRGPDAADRLADISKYKDEIPFLSVDHL